MAWQPDDEPAPTPDQERRQREAGAAALLAELGVPTLWDEGRFARMEAEAKERDAAAARRREAERREQAAAAVRAPSAQFPLMALDALFAKDRQRTPAVAWAEWFCKLTMPGMLFLAGGTGVGKTTGAALVALERGGARPGFIRANKLERAGRYDKELRPWLASRTMLVIDDLGDEVVDGHGVWISLLDDVIDEFYSSRRILVVTTNLLETQFGQRYGARAESRRQQVGHWKSCGMEDLRKPRPAT